MKDKDISIIDDISADRGIYKIDKLNKTPQNFVTENNVREKSGNQKDRSKSIKNKNKKQ